MHVRAGTDEIIGATIVSPHAGDMISEITTCIQYVINHPSALSFGYGNPGAVD
jgi:pyruvate/2-oxoglutarate dehydrogenase complex dihydrolipoamide dehydrogenase (E3) component